jgi:hypothetical protein
MLGYLDSNQEQMIAVSAVPLPRNWGGIPRISAVFMESSVRAGTGRYGPILVTQQGIWFVSGHRIGGHPDCLDTLCAAPNSAMCVGVSQGQEDDDPAFRLGPTALAGNLALRVW